MATEYKFAVESGHGRETFDSIELALHHARSISHKTEIKYIQRGYGEKFPYSRDISTTGLACPGTSLIIFDDGTNYWDVHANTYGKDFNMKSFLSVRNKLIGASLGYQVGVTEMRLLTPKFESLKDTYRVVTKSHNEVIPDPYAALGKRNMDAKKRPCETTDFVEDGEQFISDTEFRPAATDKFMWKHQLIECWDVPHKGVVISWTGGYFLYDRDLGHEMSITADTYQYGVSITIVPLYIAGGNQRIDVYLISRDSPYDSDGPALEKAELDKYNLEQAKLARAVESARVAN